MVEKYAYDGFGRELAAPSSLVPSLSSGLNSFRFSTKQLDAETGMNYYGYRYYAADSGRWINRDPIAENGGVNVYELNLNNTVNLIDCLGLQYKGYGYLDMKKGPGKCEKTFTVYIDTSKIEGYRKMMFNGFSTVLSNAYSSKGSGWKCPCTSECPDGVSILVKVVERAKGAAGTPERNNLIEINLVLEKNYRDHSGGV